MATIPRQIVPVLTPAEQAGIAGLAPQAHLTYHNGPVLTSYQSAFSCIIYTIVIRRVEHRILLWHVLPALHHT